MSETKQPGDKPLTVPANKTLSLKRPVEQGTVRQSFSHGRTNTVVVETVKRRPPVAPPPVQKTTVTAPPAAQTSAPGPARAERAPSAAPAPGARAQASAAAARALSDEEQSARNQALAEARRANEDEARQRQQQLAAERAEAARREEEARRQRQQAAAEAAAQEAAAASRAKAETPAPRPDPVPVPAPKAAPAAAPVADATPAPAPSPATAAAQAPAQRPTPDPRPSRTDPPRTTGERPMRIDGPRFAGAPSENRPPRLDGPRPAMGDRSPRPEGPRPGAGADRPYGDRPPRPAGDRPGAYADRAPRADGARTGGYGDRPAYGDRPPRPAGDRPGGYGDRQAYGDRPPRPAGDRPFGDRPPRPAGDRPGGYGDRPAYGDRPPRPAGDRPGGFGDRGPRPAGGGFGDRPPRPAGDRPFGDRPPRPPGAGPARFGFGRAPAAADAAPLVQEARRSAPPGAAPARPPRDYEEGGEGAAARRSGIPGRAAAPAKAEKPAKGAADRSRGRLTLTNALSGDDERTRSVAAFRRRVQRMKGGADAGKEKIFREVTVPETITIQELANRMSERGVDIIRLLMKQGQMHKITDTIDADTAQLIAEEMGHTVKRVAESDVVEGLFDMADADDTLEARPPIVTIMGHVDHGKTSLLDAIRKTNVVSGEAGGITQHIGAYQVTSPLGGKISFIDTPGHAAFTAMRARGAKVTDIVVLVVAANDSVMPQTIEAINHAKAARVPLIVAINKIDLPDAKPERVRSDLLQHEVVVESLGGDTLEVELSAKTGQNLDKLLETLQLQAEVLDLRANPNRAAEGTVVEAKIDRGRGPVATVLVQRGTLHTGDIVVAGAEWGRVRALIDDKGANVTEAGPSFPVEILGFAGAPEAGDRLAVVESEARAREITEYRDRMKREKAAARGAGSQRSLADMMSQIKAAGKKEFSLVVKGDVQGSVEAIVGSLEKLGNAEVGARVMHSAVGGITESDVTLANATGAVILGFNVRANKEAREAAERAGVEIRYYNIIYDLVDDVKAAMSGMLAPTLREEMLGNARILEVFNITKVGKVAGCQVTDGRVERGAKVRLIRDNVVIHEGTLKTLKRFKDEVKEVQVGQECGMAFEKYEDMRQGDVIECYRVEEIRRTL